MCVPEGHQSRQLGQHRSETHCGEWDQASLRTQREGGCSPASTLGPEPSPGSLLAQVRTCPPRPALRFQPAQLGDGRAAGRRLVPGTAPDGSSPGRGDHGGPPACRHWSRSSYVFRDLGRGALQAPLGPPRCLGSRGLVHLPGLGSAESCPESHLPRSAGAAAAAAAAAGGKGRPRLLRKPPVGLQKL